jgi:hypothetical protein
MQLGFRNGCHTQLSHVLGCGCHSAFVLFEIVFAVAWLCWACKPQSNQLHFIIGLTFMASVLHGINPSCLNYCRNVSGSA